MVSLGEFGDQWLAQQSLRTLTNASRRGGLDIKLPLTIYNTSCYRGITADTSLPDHWLHAGYNRFCDRRHPSAKRRSDTW